MGILIIENQHKVIKNETLTIYQRVFCGEVTFSSNVNIAVMAEKLLIGPIKLNNCNFGQ